MCLYIKNTNSPPISVDLIAQQMEKWARSQFKSRVLIKDKNSPPISVGLIAQQVEQWTRFLKVESSNLVYLIYKESEVTTICVWA